jgi:hypothetical protein
MSESGSLLPATSLLVPCTTVCDPSGHVAFRTVARQLTTMCRMAPPSRCPQMRREDPDHLWIPSTPRRRAGKGLGAPSAWSEEGRCGLKARHLNHLVGRHLWEAVPVSALIFFRNMDTSRPPGSMGLDVLPCPPLASTDSQSPTGDLHPGESPKHPLTVGPRRWRSRVESNSCSAVGRRGYRAVLEKPQPKKLQNTVTGVKGGIRYAG